MKMVNLGNNNDPETIIKFPNCIFCLLLEILIFIQSRTLYVLYYKYELFVRQKNKATLEILEQIEQEIHRLQQFKRVNQECQKWLMAKLLMYSILMYVVAAIVVYFYYFPESWKERILYSVPLLLFPVLIWFAKQAILWLFVKRTAKNDNALEILTSKKKQILEDVMEKETYKKAKEILEKYDPDRSKELDVQLPMQTPTNAHTLGMELRQRHGQMIHPQSFQQRPAVTPATISMTPARPVQPVGSMYMGMTPYGTRDPTQKVQSGVLLNSQNIDGDTIVSTVTTSNFAKRSGILDRLLEYLVGDGPQNRYALICQSCFSHNGMAMKEEFEYIAFRCCYCYTVNPAKKIRPLAPRIGCQRSAPVISMVSHHGVPFSQPSSPAQLICSAETMGTELPMDTPHNTGTELPTATEPTMGTVLPPEEVPLANNGRSDDAGKDGVSIENVGAVICKLVLQEEMNVETNAPSASSEAAKETITKETK